MSGDELRTAFINHFNLAMQIGAPNMINPIDGRALKLGSQDFKKLYERFSAENEPEPVPEQGDEPLALEPATPVKKTMKNKITSGMKKYEKMDDDEYRTLQRQFHANPNINPKTNRPISVNSATYGKLIKEFGAPK